MYCIILLSETSMRTGMHVLTSCRLSIFLSFPHLRIVVTAASALFRSAQRVLIFWEEDQKKKMCHGIVLACYRDGCPVSVEVNDHPLTIITRFFTYEQLSLWNPRPNARQKGTVA